MKVLGQGRGAAPSKGGMAATACGKRDRHGRVIGDAESAEQLALLIELAPAFEALAKIARRVFIDRNAAGFPDQHRAAIRASVRPVLRKALAHAALARTAILRADRPTFDLQLSYARGFLQHADVLFSQPAKDIATKYSTAQRDKAKKRNKVPAVQQGRIQRRYTALVADGKKYGAIKALAAEYDVSESTVKRILDKTEKNLN
jgi:hypothetical protein